MKITSTNLLLVFSMLFPGQILAQQTSLESFKKTIEPEDLVVLLGDWTGSLTYVDYSSNKPYTMPAKLMVKQGKNDYQLTLLYTYPNEPKANSKEKVTVSKDGKLLNNKSVKSIQRLSDGQVKITTEYDGKDNKKNAIIRNMFILGSELFVIRKEVKFENSDEWLQRNEYSFKR